MAFGFDPWPIFQRVFVCLRVSGQRKADDMFGFSANLLNALLTEPQWQHYDDHDDDYEDDDNDIDEVRLNTMEHTSICDILKD